MRRYLPFCAVLVLSCGSRSGLLDATSTDGGGGISGSGANGGSGGFAASGGVATGGIGGTGAMGGTGGSGGSAVACTQLVRLDPIVSAPKPDDQFDTEPAFTYATDDGQKVALAFIRQPVESPQSFAELRHVSLFPWANWPPDMSTPAVTFAGPTLMTEFSLAPTASNFIGEVIGHPGVVSFAREVSSDGLSVGPTITMYGDSPAFASAHGPSLHAVGTRMDDNTILANVVNSFGDLTVGEIACADAPLFAGAVPWENGWLVAHSNGANVPVSDSCPPAGSGQPTRIDIKKLNSPLSTEFLASLQVATPVIDLTVAPHPNGIYVVWRQASGGAVSPIRWTRYDSNVGFLGPSEVSTPDDYPLEFAATALGDHLVVVYGSDPANNPPDLVLKVLDDSGGVLAAHAFEPGFFGKLAVIGAPSAKSLLVGFQTSGSSAIDLVRFDCVP